MTTIETSVTNTTIIDTLPTPSSVLLQQGSSKIQSEHLERLAIVYVRQSSPRQVLNNRESRELQYGLVGLATSYGWHDDRILVIDDDQGKSGETAENRFGFQRLLAEVSLNHVGLVLGTEMSRLARCCKDWYHLLELCGVFGTLLADQDGLYEPGNYNDRLLLGLKGTMSEAELHIIRNRMDQGRRNKARRGELFGRLPMGYMFDASGDVVHDPDEQTRALVRMIFDKFEELGTARGVLLYLKRNHIKLPFRSYVTPNKGEVEWRLATASTIYGILKHPFYAGAYAYGRRKVDRRRRQNGQPHSGRVCQPIDAWEVLIHDHMPAFITWEQYTVNQQRLLQNRSHPNSLGAPRQGQTLLGGLVKCGRCGWKMRVLRHTVAGTARYHCPSQEKEGDHTQCQSLPTDVLDQLVSSQVLKAVEPSALELSRKAATDIEQERRRLLKNWQQQLERAKYEVQRARRQYDTVDPENRLVAAELERQWEATLREQCNLQDEYDREGKTRPAELTPEEHRQIETLSTDLPSLWNDASTSAVDRQEVVRCLIEKIIVNARGQTEMVDVEVHWCGGYVGHHEIRRPVGRYEFLADFERMKTRIIELRGEGQTAGDIANALNTEGYYPPRQRQKFNAVMIRMLIKRLGLNSSRADAVNSEHLLGENESWIREVCHELGIPQSVMCKWCVRGWVHARKVMISRRRWIVWADDDERERLKRLHTHRRIGPQRCYPEELTTPKQRELK